MTTMCIGWAWGHRHWEKPAHADYGTDYTPSRWSRSMSAADFHKLAELFPGETVTHSYVQDIKLPAVNGTSPGTFALVTLDNGLDHSKPTTLGPEHPDRAGHRTGGSAGPRRAGRDRRRRRDRQAVLPGRGRGPVHGQISQRPRTGPLDGPARASMSTPPWPTSVSPASRSSTAWPWAAAWRSPCSPPTATVSTGAGALALPEAFIGLIRAGAASTSAAADRPRERRQGHDREPAEQQPHPDRPAGLRTRRRRRHLRATRTSSSSPSPGPPK